MAEAAQNTSRATMRARFHTFNTKRVIRHYIEYIEFIWIEIVVILRVRRRRSDDLTDRGCPRVRQELENSQSLIYPKPFHRVGDQTHLARRNANIFCNSPDLHYLTSLPNRSGLFILTARVATEVA